MSMTQEPNVFVLTADSLSQSAFLPYINEIAELVNGVSFTQAVATGCHTASAIPGLAAGIYDDRLHSQGIFEEGGPTPIAESFLKCDYDTSLWTDNFLFGSKYNYDRGFVSGNLGAPSQKKQISMAIQQSHLSPAFSAFEWMYFNVVQRLQDYVGEYRPFYQTAEHLNQSVLKWFANEASNPTFCWVHYMDTHHPYEPPMSYLDADALNHDWTRSELGEVSRSVIKSNGKNHKESEVADVCAAYKAVCRYFADEILSFIETLIEREHFKPDRDILVFSADHGEQLDPELTGVLGHVPPTFSEDVINVPLMIATPEWSAGTVNEQVSLIDLVPTLANLAGVDIPDTAEGNPADRPSDLIREFAFAVSRAHGKEDEAVRTYRMVRQSDWKLFAQENPLTNREEYFLTNYNGDEKVMYRANDPTPPESNHENERWKTLWSILDEEIGVAFEVGLEGTERSTIPREHLKDLGYLNE